MPTIALGQRKEKQAVCDTCELNYALALLQIGRNIAAASPPGSETSEAEIDEFVQEADRVLAKRAASRA